MFSDKEGMGILAAMERMRQVIKDRQVDSTRIKWRSSEIFRVKNPPCQIFEQGCLWRQ